MTNTYGAKNGLLIKSTYGNGAYVENVYDRYDRVTGIKYNGTQQFGYVYNANGLVSKHTDNINGKTQGDGSSVLTKDELRGIFLSRW